MARRTNNKKINFSKVAKNALISAGTGAVAHVVAEAIDLKNESIMDYIFIGAGIVAPEVIKGEEVEMAGTALTAVGAYRLSQRYGIAEKLGFNAPKTAGLPEDYTIGSTDYWTSPSASTVYTEEKKSEGQTTVQ